MSNPPRVIGSEAFDAWYYAASCGRPYRRDAQWLAFFGAIADRIASDIQPRSVLDVGCAMGFLVEGLRARNIEAFGIDTSSFAIDQVVAPIKPFCKEGSATDEFGREYDLITVVEVLEHLAARDAELAIENICRHTRDVLFSSSPDDYKEATHVNVRPPEYWAEQFGRRGFFRDTSFDASFLTAWAVRFRKSGEPAHRIASDYERMLSRVEIERNHLRNETLATRGQMSEMAAQLARAQQELQSARREIAETAASTEQAVRAARAEAVEAHTQAAKAREMVATMERSRFWRARQVWVALRRRWWG